MQVDTGGIIIIVVIAAIIAAIIYFNMRRKGQGFSFNIGKWFSGNHAVQDNCFIIYDDHIAFEHKEESECLGVPWEFINEGRYYYVHECIKDNTEKFVLPDVDANSQHYDPVETKNVLKMYKNKEFFNWSGSTFQKIAIGVMAFVVLGEFVMLIILSGGNSGG